MNSSRYRSSFVCISISTYFLLYTFQLTCNFPSEDLGFVLENVRELSDFVDFNSKFDMGPTDTG